MYSSANVDTVVSVSINGETDFSVDNEYPKDAEVIITYHMPAVFMETLENSAETREKPCKAWY